MMSSDGYAWFRHEMGGWHWDEPEHTATQNPITQANALRTPTLVVHGLLDYRVPDAQGLAYYNTLKARGVPAKLLWFPDENHWVLKPRNSKQWYAAFFEWLERFDVARGVAAKPVGKAATNPPSSKAKVKVRATR
jgi:dipeptidyl aminopeptidase/acylaminoacyl peptidase